MILTCKILILLGDVGEDRIIFVILISPCLAQVVWAGWFVGLVTWLSSIWPWEIANDG